MKVQLPTGEVVEAQDVEIVDEKAPWTVIKLEDGATIRIRLIITKVMRTEAYNQATGDPVYNVVADRTYRVSVPRELKRKDAPVKLKGPDTSPEVR